MQNWEIDKGCEKDEHALRIHEIERRIRLNERKQDKSILDYLNGRPTPVKQVKKWFKFKLF